MTDAWDHHRLLTVLFWACCVAWTAMFGLGFYLLLRAPEWVGRMMLQ